MNELILNFKGVLTKEGLLIENVPISVIEQFRQGPKSITKEDANHFISSFYLRKQKGKVGAFVRLNHGGPGIGRIVELKIDGPFLSGDLLITDKKAQELIDQGDLTERSIEWFTNTTPPLLMSVALLSGHFGQDSEEFADLTVDIAKDFGIENPQIVTRLYEQPVSGAKLKSETKKESKMAFTPEDIKMLVEALKPTIKELVSENKVEAEPVNEKQIKTKLEELHKKELSITINGYVDALVRKGGYANSDNLRKNFAKFGDNIQAMEVEYKRLMEKAEEDVQVEMEREYEAPKLEDDLKASYKTFKQNYPKSDTSEAQFVSICRGDMKADLSGKALNYVDGSEKI